MGQQPEKIVEVALRLAMVLSNLQDWITYAKWKMRWMKTIWEAVLMPIRSKCLMICTPSKSMLRTSTFSLLVPI